MRLQIPAPARSAYREDRGRRLRSEIKTKVEPIVVETAREGLSGGRLREGDTSMRLIDRRTALRLSAAGFLAAPAVLRAGVARGAEFALKYANNAPETHPLTVRIREALQAIRAETGGRV